MTTGVRSMNATRSSDVPVIRSKLFFFEMTQTASLPNLLRADIKSLMPSNITKPGSRMESGQIAPIVTINDLAKADELGDTVRFDIEHDLCGAPTMCCDSLEGKEEDTTYTSFELKIGMTRHGIKEHCSMNRKRLGKQTFDRARPKLSRYMAKLKAERCIYHLAGARGHFTKGNQVIGLAHGSAQGQFENVMINCVTPPTHCRHYYGGTASSLDGKCGDAITKDDVFMLSTITNIMAAMEEAERPLRPIQLEGSPDPIYLLLVTPAQWRDFQNSTDGKYFRELQANALARAAMCSKHAIFQGTCLMWENVLVRKYTDPVRFKPGLPVHVSNEDCDASVRVATLPVDNNFYVDRAILLGGAALAEAYGSVNDAEGNHFGKMNYAFHKSNFDGGEGQRVHIKGMDGEKKIRFAGKDGCIYDHGVAVIDTAVCITNHTSC